MPKQFLRDVADIMAERPLREDEGEPAPGMKDWRRQPSYDFQGIHVWEAPTGELVGVASPELRRKLKRAQVAN